MKRLVPYVAFTFLTGFTVLNSLPVVAGGCSSHMNKTEVNKCDEDDIDCQSEKAENLRFKESVKS